MPDVPFQIVGDPDDGVFDVLLQGDIDMTCREGLHQMIEQYSLSRSGDVHLDLDRVTYLDSTGLAALAELATVAGQRGRVVRVVRAPDPIWHLLRISAMTDILEGPPPV